MLLLFTFVLSFIAPSETSSKLQVYHNKLLMSHSFGLTSDAASHLENLTLPKNSKDSTFKTTDLGEICDEDCLQYVKDNFGSGKENTDDVKNNIVIPHLEQLDQNSINFKIAKMFVRYLLPKQNSFLFTSCNLYKYLQMIEHSEADIKVKYGHDLREDLFNVMVIYPADINAVILITLPENENETIHSLHSKANSNVNAYQSLHLHHILGNDKFCIVNVVGAVFHKKPQHSQQRYCTRCEPLLTIFSDDIKDEKNLTAWWGSLIKIIKDKIELRWSQNHTVGGDFKRKTASRLVVINALTDDRFPKLFDPVDDRIKKMCLNEIQRNILLSPELKKLIKGEQTFFFCFLFNNQTLFFFLFFMSLIPGVLFMLNMFLMTFIFTVFCFYESDIHNF